MISRRPDKYNYKNKSNFVSKNKQKVWHSELHYRIESEHDASKQLIVKCMPELPEHMSIDANNELHIDVRADIKELLNRGSGV